MKSKKEYKRRKHRIKTMKKNNRKYSRKNYKRMSKRMSKRIGKRMSKRMRGGGLWSSFKSAVGFGKSVKPQPQPQLQSLPDYSQIKSLSVSPKEVSPKLSIMSIFKSNKIQPEPNQFQQQENANNSTIPYFQTILTLFDNKPIDNTWNYGSNIAAGQYMLTRCSNETYNNASTKKAGDIDKFIPFLPIPENGLNSKIRVVCHSGVMR